LGACGTRWCLADDAPTTCATCHAPQAEQLAKSVHERIQCQECHGGEKAYAVPAGDLDPYRTQPPGTRPAFDHGTGFAGKPARRDVPDRCGTCHADVERMNPYGLRTDQLAQYKTSGHGKTLYGRGDDRVAVCTDCHGSHNVFRADDPQSATHPLNVPDMCAKCHENKPLMDEYQLPVEVVAEYRQSVHGRLLLESGDTGAPTCASCHGNHAAMPPGFASVGAVCGQCHEHDARNFAASIHASQEGHKGCVQCHGGGRGRHDHLIERIMQPPGVLIQRYAHLLTTHPHPTEQEISQTIHPDPKRIITQALPTCTECHESLEEDESLPKLFALLDEIAAAEKTYVQTARRLDEVGQGVLLVDNQRFLFQDAKTHLIELAPIQHTLDTDLVGAKVKELNEVCGRVNAQLDGLERGLQWRRRLLLPIWAFAGVFALVLYAKYRSLKAVHVQSDHSPAQGPAAGGPPPTRRTFLDWLIGLGSTVVAAALAIPGLMYLWPAAKGGASSNVEVEGAGKLQPGESLMVQVGARPAILVRDRTGFKAFSAVCTHLGCLVKWESSAQEFRCPCHAAVFDAEGGVVSGPPPSPLPRFKVKEVGDKVFVSPA